MADISPPEDPVSDKGIFSKIVNSEMAGYSLIAIFCLVITVGIFYGLYSAQSDVDARAELCHKVFLPAKKNIPELICMSYRSWDTLATVLQVSYILIGIIAIGASSAIAFNSTQSKNSSSKALFIAATISWGAIAGFDLGGASRATRQAWRELNNSIIKYETDDKYDSGKLFESYTHAVSVLKDAALNKDAAVPTK